MLQRAFAARLEVTIYTFSYETPPSYPFGALKTQQSFASRLRQSIRRILGRVFNLLLTAFFFLFVTLNQVQEFQALLREKNAPLSYDKEEQINLAVNKYISTANLESTLNDQTLAAVARQGINVGGSDGAKVMTQHTVEDGDTLSTIAEKYGLRSGSIVLANPDLKDTELINIGMVLNIPPNEASPEELAKEAERRQARIAAQQAEQAAKQGVLASAWQKATSIIKKDSGWIMPISYQYVSQGYNPVTHPGLDLVASLGTPIRAAKSGYVITRATGWNGGYGNWTRIDHGGGVVTYYAHQQYFANNIYVGKYVNQGDIIGYVGSTGRSTGPHLHYEKRVNGVPINPW